MNAGKFVMLSGVLVLAAGVVSNYLAVMMVGSGLILIGFIDLVRHR